jgi:hypothetical protein
MTAICPATISSPGNRGQRALCGASFRKEQQAMTMIVDLPAVQPHVFIDRRSGEPGQSPNRERRQFADSHSELSLEAQELAAAIDKYKLVHRRRFITYEEMLNVVKSLGYHR